MPGLIKYDRFEQFTGGGGGINLFESAARTRPVETTDPITFETISEPIKILGFEIASFNEWLYYLSWASRAAHVRGSPGCCCAAGPAVRSAPSATASWPRPPPGSTSPSTRRSRSGSAPSTRAIAGSLLAIATTFVNPDTYPITLSIFLLVGVVVGGLGSLWPLVFGAIFIQFLPLWAQEVSKAQGAPAVVYGVILILVMILLPGGAAGLIRRLQAFTRGYHRGR